MEREIDWNESVSMELIIEIRINFNMEISMLHVSPPGHGTANKEPQCVARLSLSACNLM